MGVAVLRPLSFATNVGVFPDKTRESARARASELDRGGRQAWHVSLDGCFSLPSLSLS